MAILNGQRRCRVVHITRGLDIGGQEKLLVEFARCADRTRFDLHFISVTDRGRLARALTDLGWPVTALEAPEGLRPGLVLRLAGWLRQLRPHVVHTHDDRPLVYTAGAARLAHVPCLLHTRHYVRLPQVTPRQQALLTLAARLARRIVCVSQDGARMAVAQGASPKKVVTIRNGIDLDRFAFRGRDSQGPVITVARLSPEKDIANLLRATAQVIQAEPSFRLDIAGAGPCQHDLERLAADLCLRQHVRFLGEVGDVPALLACARAFVLPSLTEGISLTILEAMATGLPVVATKVGGNPEVVVPGKTGLLVPAQDSPALAEALLRVWRDPDEARRLGEAGRKRVEQNFDVRSMVTTYEELYLNALRCGQRAKAALAG